VRWLGRPDDEELAALLRGALCLAYPSLWEGFGIPVLEAMLCGTPVVASALPGVRQPVTVTGMGAIAPIGDPAGLAVALGKVLAERARYVRPRAEIAARFDLAATAAFYERLYGDVRREMQAAAAPRPSPAPTARL
jgi:glycosyltransferase involved in cell wall biosynthesis